MAVVVQCYHCDTILELDEGFRGGVCRCSTCGSLLQVPKAATTGTPKARPASPGAQPTNGAGRPSNPNADPGLSRGQFDPANQASGKSGVRPAVPDFGGSSSGMRAGRPAAPTASTAPAPTAKAPRRIEKVEPISGPTRPGVHLKRVKKNNALLYVGLALGAMIIVIVIVVVVMVIMSPAEDGKKPKQENDGTTGGTATPGSTDTGKSGNTAIDNPPVRAKGFAGIPLTGKRIIISVDGASSMVDSFDFVMQGIYNAVDALEPGQQLKVVLWKGTALKNYPSTGYVSKDGLKDLKQQLNSLTANGSSDAAQCMKATARLDGDQIIFVTAKFGLESSMADDVLAVKTGTVRFDGLKIEAEDAQSPLEILATKTGGTYLFVTGGKLQQLVK